MTWTLDTAGHWRLGEWSLVGGEGWPWTLMHFDGRVAWAVDQRPRCSAEHARRWASRIIGSGGPPPPADPELLAIANRELVDNIRAICRALGVPEDTAPRRLPEICRDLVKQAGL